VEAKKVHALSCRAVSTVVDKEASNLVQQEAPVLPFRIGHGFDLHRLEPGLPLIVGGVNIPHDRGCEAHSDGMRRVSFFSFHTGAALSDLTEWAFLNALQLITPLL
jgi:hypothetical protein